MCFSVNQIDDLQSTNKKWSLTFHLPCKEWKHFDRTYTNDMNISKVKMTQMDMATIEYNFYRKFNFSAACEPRLDIAQRFSSRTQQHSESLLTECIYGLKSKLGYYVLDLTL